MASLREVVKKTVFLGLVEDLRCLLRLRKLVNLRTFCANFHLVQKYATANFYAFLFELCVHLVQF